MLEGKPSKRTGPLCHLTSGLILYKSFSVYMSGGLALHRRESRLGTRDPAYKGSVEFANVNPTRRASPPKRAGGDNRINVGR